MSSQHAFFDQVNANFDKAAAYTKHDRSLLDVRPRRVLVLDEGQAVDVPGGLGAPALAHGYAE